MLETTQKFAEVAAERHGLQARFESELEAFRVAARERIYGDHLRRLEESAKAAYAEGATKAELGRAYGTKDNKTISALLQGAPRPDPRKTQQKSTPTATTPTEPAARFYTDEEGNRFAEVWNATHPMHKDLTVAHQTDIPVEPNPAGTKWQAYDDRNLAGTELNERMAILTWMKSTKEIQQQAVDTFGPPTLD